MSETSQESAERALLSLRREEETREIAAPAETIRVLLIEDNPGDAVLVREMLEQVETSRYEVDWVVSVEEGIKALARDAHDIGVVDYELAGGTALDILREAVACHWTAPIIVLTGLSRPEIDLYVMKIGAHDFLGKDELRTAVLDRSIRYAIQKKRTEAALYASNKELLRYIAELKAANQQIELRGHSIVSLAHHLASGTPPGSDDFRLQQRRRMMGQSAREGELGVWTFTGSGRTIDANPMLLQLFEVTELSELQNREFDVLLADESRQSIERALPHWSASAADTVELEIIGQRSGRRNWIVVSGLGLGADDDTQTYMATVVDITERKNKEEATRYLARHDTLTGLANRSTLAESLRHAMAITRRNDTLLALLCLDLNGFKTVNDIHGHKIGDLLLREVGTRLTDQVRASDTVARLGGDEFVVVATNLERPEDASVLAEKIVERLSEPFLIRGQNVACGASIGIALFPKDCADVEQLIDSADLALCRAKQSGSKKWQFFDSAMNNQLIVQRELENDIRCALKNGQFELAYQPLFDMADGSFCGLEALLRWQRPDAQDLTIRELVRSAENNGLIVQIGAWVLRAACRDFASWARDIMSVTLVVNVSSMQLRAPGFADLISKALESARLDPARLRLDITGRASERDHKVTLESLERLRVMGVGLTLDGFGRVEEGLTNLQDLPIDQVKFDDQLMISGMTSNRGEAFARALVQLGRLGGLSIAAKGIESEQSLAFARSLECDQVQGTHLNPPLAADAVSDWLRDTATSARVWRYA